MPVIRYPGSKAKLVDAIIARFPHQMRGALWMDAAGWEYREPFFGSGAIGIEILRELPERCKAWINDRDFGLSSMWLAIRDTPEQLCDKIDDFEPTADRFYEYKAEDGELIDPTEAGFRKLALHAMSYSGLGAMAGGPLGGRAQANPKYNPSCRWNPEYRQSEVMELHNLFKSRRVKITGGDFSALIDGNPKAFIYADPPYVEKGPELYKHSFNDADHARLAKCLNRAGGSWVVSYDDHPLIHKLYAGHRIVPIDVMYTVARENEQRRKNREILICKDAA